MITLGECLMINRRALAVASGHAASSTVIPVVLADFSPAGIVEMNRDLIADYGGLHLAPDNLRESARGRLEYTVAQMHGDYLPACPYTRAAWLWDRLIQSHLFHDGNKRTALAALLAYLNTLGIVLYLPDHLVDRWQRQIMAHTLSTDDLARQLKKCR